MATEKVNIGKLSNEVMDMLNEYNNSVEVVLTEELDSVSKEGVKKLKGESPKQSGEYAKSWKRKMTGKNTLHPEIVLYNEKYQLTHLLEFGHIKVLWGNRTNSMVAPIMHIAPINDWCQENVVDNVSMRISKGLK